MAQATVNFWTEALKRPITINVIFPTDKICVAHGKIPKSAPMKTLYLLEGVTGNYSGMLGYTRIQALAEDYNICIVMASGENKWYANSDISGEYHADLIAKDLVQFTRQTFNLSDRREDTYIGGFSMGGFGAAVIGLSHPELFSHIILLEAALHKAKIMASSNAPTSDERLDLLTKSQYETAFGLKDIKDFEGCPSDYEYLARKLAESGAEKPKVFFNDGKLGTMHKVDVPFKELLDSLGYETTMTWAPGGHSWATLELGLKDALDWLPLDTFEGNVPEYDPMTHFSGDAFFHGQPYYTVINNQNS